MQPATTVPATGGLDIGSDRLIEFKVSGRSVPLLTLTDSAESFFRIDRLVVGRGWLVNIFDSGQKAR